MRQPVCKPTAAHVAQPPAKSGHIRVKAYPRAKAGSTSGLHLEPDVGPFGERWVQSAAPAGRHHAASFGLNCPMNALLAGRLRYGATGSTGARSDLVAFDARLSMTILSAGRSGRARGAFRSLVSVSRDVEPRRAADNSNIGYGAAGRNRTAVWEPRCRCCSSRRWRRHSRGCGARRGVLVPGADLKPDWQPMPGNERHHDAGGTE